MASGQAEIVACVTCGRVEPAADGRPQGEHLLERLRDEAAQRTGAQVVVSDVRCLWACQKSCAVMLRSEGRVGYVIVGLEPSQDSARALLDYAQLYLQSNDGAVPYRTWPTLLKGHFHCRIPRATEPGEPESTKGPSS
jgi:predicted metal-binding protein